MRTAARAGSRTFSDGGSACAAQQRWLEARLDDAGAGRAGCGSPGPTGNPCGWLFAGGAEAVGVETIAHAEALEAHDLAAQRARELRQGRSVARGPNTLSSVRAPSILAFNTSSCAHDNSGSMNLMS